MNFCLPQQIKNEKILNSIKSSLPSPAQRNCQEFGKTLNLAGRAVPTATSCYIWRRELLLLSLHPVKTSHAISYLSLTSKISVSLTILNGREQKKLFECGFNLTISLFQTRHSSLIFKNVWLWLRPLPHLLSFLRFKNYYMLCVWTYILDLLISSSISNVLLFLSHSSFANG